MQRLLRRLGHHFLATRVVFMQWVAELLEESDPAAMLRRLKADGLIQVHRGFPGNRVLYQLTKKGASVAGVTVARSRKVGGQALPKHLGALLFCHADGTVRYRVEPAELAEVLGAQLTDRAFCIAVEKGKPIVYECYVPGGGTQLKAILRRLEQTRSEFRKQKPLAQAIDDRRLGVAVIVSQPSRRKQILDAARTATADQPCPLVKRIHIRVEAFTDLEFFLPGSTPQCLGRMRGADRQTLLPLEEQPLTETNATQSAPARGTPVGADESGRIAGTDDD